MLLASFLQNRSQAISPQGVVGDCQQITQPQPAAVAHQNPRGQQHFVRAMQRTPRHLRGYRKQVSHLLVSPSTDHRKIVFDSADRTCTIVHQQAVPEGGFAKGAKHSSVVVDRGGGEMTQRFGEVGIDVVDCQITHPPRQPLGQDNELLRVAGTSPRTEGIGSRKIRQGHGFCGLKISGVIPAPGGEDIAHFQSANPPGMIQFRMAPLAQLDSVGRRIPPSGWISRIIRGAVLASLVTLLFLHAVGTLLTLLALGQLGRAVVLFRRDLRMESIRRTEAASF